MRLRLDSCGLFIAAVFFIVFIPSAGRACSCVGTGGCDTGWKHGQIVFVGEVRAKDAIPREGNDLNSTFLNRIAVHFSVQEVLAGRVVSQKDTIVTTGVGGGDCGYPFVVGQTYLVYASTYQDRISTSICTQTRPAVMAGGLMRQLRAVSKQVEQATLFGIIGTAPRGNGYEDQIESKALAGVRVRAIGSKGLDYSATSDDQGVYAFGFLPADTYQVEVDLPTGLSTWQQNTGKPIVLPIGITEDSRGCALDVFARPDGRVSGVVVDGDGKAVAGFVTIVPADPKEAEAAQQRGGLPGFESADGKFTLWQIPPGRYQLTFYPKVNGQVSFRNQFRSQTIDLGFGQKIENFQFKISSSN
jgi:hypothetical protein